MKHRRIDKSALAIPTPFRTKAPQHVRDLHREACAVPGCNCTDMTVHHLTIGPEGKAMSRKASDRYSLPICRPHHQTATNSLHNTGNERAFWAAVGVLDPVALADRYWATSGKEMP